MWWLVQSALAAEVPSTYCLRMESVAGTTLKVAGRDDLEIAAVLRNACGKRIVGYAGLLRLTSKDSTISTSRSLYAMKHVIEAGALGNGSWRLPLWGRPQDVWLGSAPTDAMTIHFFATLLVFDDGTVATYAPPFTEDVPDATPPSSRREAQ